MASPTTDPYTMPRTSQMATRNLLTTASTHPSSGDTSPTDNNIPTLHRAPTNNYEEARAAANKALPTDGTDATSTTAAPNSPNATREDLKRCQHEGLFKKGGNGAGYYSTSG